MAISYNLTFQKINSSGRTILEKEGEILLHERGFQLKGKGAYDHGELIHFADIDDVTVRDEAMNFTTFQKYQFSLRHFGNLFEQFVCDFFRVRNEFLTEALFFKQKKFLSQYDGVFERLDPDSQTLLKGHGKIRLYEESLVVLPGDAESFSVPFAFLKFHEFDEDEYRLNMTLENGETIVLSQFGNHYEEFQERFEQTLSSLYGNIVKQLQNFFISFHADSLVKLANLMKSGKAVCMREIQKIDKDLAKAVYDAIFKDEVYLETIGPLKKKIDDEDLFLGLHVIDGKKDVYSFVVVFPLPSRNLLVCTLGSYEGELRKVQDTFFFRLKNVDTIGGNAGAHAVDNLAAAGNNPVFATVEEEIKSRVMSLNQALTLLHFVPDPFYKDQKELQKSLYRLAIRKLPFLCELRKSFLGRCPSILPDLFLRNFERCAMMAEEHTILTHNA